ncbi:MAG: hypothetical protein ABIH11_04050, partial [Candidatus Altiarchaeota archaeon]
GDELHGLFGGHETFTGEVEVHPNGLIQPRAYNNPEGGLTYEKAVQEEEGCMAFHRKGRAAEIVIGKGRFTKGDVQGDAMGYTKTLTSSSSTTAQDDMVYAIVDEFRNYLIGDIDAAMARIRINNIFMRMGRALRGAHDDDLFHGYPSPDNMVKVDGEEEYRFKDFHQSKDISGATKAQKLAYMIHDVAACVRHTTFHISKGSEELGPEFRELPKFLQMIGAAPANYIVRGYLHDRPGDPRTQGIHQNDVERTFAAFTGAQIQPSMEFLGMMGDVVEGVLRAEHAKPTGIRFVPVLPSGASVSLQECIMALQSTRQQLDRITHMGWGELALTQKEGKEGVVTDRESNAIIMYLPQGIDAGRLGGWVNQELSGVYQGP